MTRNSMASKHVASTSMTGSSRRFTVVALTSAMVLAGCTGSPGSAETPVPHFTVGGDQTSAPSLSPSEVLAARKAAGIAACPASDPSAAGVQDGLPKLTLQCMGGDSSVNLAGLATGRPRVVNVWAQWCQPCTDEAPHMGAVAKQAAGKVDFLGIDYADPFQGKAVAFARQYGLQFPQLVDPDRDSRAPLRLQASIPQTLFVDAKGRIVHRETVSFTSEQQLRDAIRTHLGVSLP